MLKHRKNDIYILVVDDSRLERKGILSLLENMKTGNLYLFSASNGLEALQILEKEKIDILITDLKMPIMDGVELARKAKNILSDLFIIFYSAYEEFEYAKSAIMLGVVYYLVKPIDINEFNTIIEDVVNRLFESKIQKEFLRQMKNKYGDKFSSLKKRSDHIYTVKAVIEILETRYMEDLSLFELSKEVNLSEGYLSHLFKEETKLGITEYLQDIRINVAKELLETKTYKIKDIARAIGYGSTSYFCSIFKSVIGISASEYREKHYRY